MSIEADDVLRVVQTLNYVDGNIAQNVFNCIVQGAGPYTEADIILDMEDWMDEVYGNLAANIANNLTAGDVKIYKRDTVGDDWDEVGTGTVTFVPANTQEMLPHGVACMSRALTTDPDVQGRKFWAGFVEGNQIDGSWMASLTTAVGAATADWITSFVGAATGSTFWPGVWSVVQNDFKGFLSAYIVNTIINYQRRRRPGVGV